MIDCKVSLRKDAYRAIKNFISDEGFVQDDAISEGLLYIINMISDYHEEGVPLFPDVLLIDSAVFFTTVPSEIIVVRKNEKIAPDEFSMAIKMCAPLAIDGWNIFLLLGANGTFDYGLINASLSQMSVSLCDQVVTTPKELCNSMYIRNIGNKVVEMCSIGGTYSISLNLVESEHKLDDVVKTLVASILSNVEEKECPCKNSLHGFIENMIIEALNSGHGNLIAVCDDIQVLKDEGHLKNGVYLDNMIDFVMLACKNESESSDISATTLQKYAAVVKCMIIFDGITIFDTRGRVCGYHFIVDNNYVQQQMLEGGSRTRAFYALSKLNGIVSCFMKSQDGKLKFEKK